MRKQEETWRAERDLEILMDAEKIRADPKRMKRAAELAKERMLAVASVAAEAGEAVKKS
jgi:hypothetical protein